MHRYLETGEGLHCLSLALCQSLVCVIPLSNFLVAPPLLRVPFVMYARNVIQLVCLDGRVSSAVS